MARYEKNLKNILLGVIGRFAVRIAGKTGVEAELRHLVDYVSKSHDEESAVPPPAVKNAEAIAVQLERYNPNVTLIGIDGLPGSGKSTLARALGARMKMGVVCFDHKSMNKPISFNKKKAIFEHHRLFRTQRLDKFDALIYIKSDEEEIRRRIIKRQRGGLLLECFDFSLLKKIGELAFSMTAGHAFEYAGGTVKLKIKSGRGYGFDGNLVSALRSKGYGTEAYRWLNQEQKLFLFATGKPKKGLLAYINSKMLQSELLAAIKEGAT